VLVCSNSAMILTTNDADGGRYVCDQIVKLKQIEHVIYEKRVLYSMNFPFCVRSEFTFKVILELFNFC